MPVGYKPTEETRKKLRLASMGNKYGLGHKHTEEWKQDMSRKMKGRVFTEDHRRNLSAALMGRKGPTLSEEAKKKISLAAMGNQRTKGLKHTEEAKAKISLANKGRKFTEEHRRNLSLSSKGKRLGNQNAKGMKHTDEAKRRISEGNKKWIRTEEYCRGIGRRFKGKKHAEEHRIKNSLAKQAYFAAGNPASFKGCKHTEEAKRKNSLAHKVLYQDPDYCRRWAERATRRPNNMETTLFNLLGRLFPGRYQYVGDFSFWIGGKNPDFVSMEYRSVVELFGEFWHKEDGEEQKRVDHFIRNGYKAIVIWCAELKNLLTLEGKLRAFHRLVFRRILSVA